MLFRSKLASVKCLSLFVATALLAACGGGGSSDSGGGDTISPTPTLSFSLTNNEISLNEDTSATIGLVASHSEGAAVAFNAQLVEGLNDSLSFTIDNSQLIVDASEVDENTRATIAISATSGELSQTQMLLVSIVDTSPAFYRLSFADSDEQNLIRVSAEENSTLTFAMIEDTDSAEAATYTYESNSNAIFAQVVNQTLQLDIGELENNANVLVTVTGSVEGLSDLVQVQLDLTDTSGQEIAQQALSWMALDNVFKFDDFELVAPLYAKALYFAEAISIQEKNTLLNDFTAALARAREASQTEDAGKLALERENYLAGIASEHQLIQALEQHQTLAQRHSDDVIDALNVISTLSDDLPTITSAQYQYIAQYNVFSAVIGNDLLGSYQDNTWHFSGEYHFLNQKVPALGNLSTCNVE